MDPVVGRWVIVASERGNRPINYKNSYIPENEQHCRYFKTLPVVPYYIYSVSSELAAQSLGNIFLSQV
jgi:hypothetical protein